MDELQEFINLSRILTGFNAEIEINLATAYYNRLKEDYPAELTVLLTGFFNAGANKHKAVKEHLLFQNFDMVLQIVNIWYTSRYINRDKKPKDGTVDQHKKALQWQILQAPPRSYSDTAPFGVYGYWQNKPV
jgi:hypothetical protein